MAAGLTAAQTPAQQQAATQYAPNGQPTLPSPQPYGQPAQTSNGQPQLSPEQQQAQQLAGKERELAFNSRFASNLAYTSKEEDKTAQLHQNQPGGPMIPVSDTNPYAAAMSGGPSSSLTASRAAGEQPNTTATATKRGPEVNVDAAVGQPYVVFEETTLDTVLMNRLDGDAPGPVRCSSRTRSIHTIISTSSFQTERSCWGKQRRFAPAASVSSGACQSYSIDSSCRMVQRGP